MADPKPGKARKTRHTSGCHMSAYLGKGMELLHTEVPTLRSALQKALLVQEEFIIREEGDRRNLMVGEMMDQVVPCVMAQWHKANVKFAPPVIITEGSLKKRLIEAWSKVQVIARGKANKSLKETWEGKLDKLLDLTVCRCKIILCTDLSSPCQGNKTMCKSQGGAHITCSCILPNKLPVLELAWMLAQREKNGEVSTMAIGGDDAKETARQVQASERKEKQEINQKRKKREGKYQY